MEDEHVDDDEDRIPEEQLMKYASRAVEEEQENDHKGTLGKRRGCTFLLFLLKEYFRVGKRRTQLTFPQLGPPDPFSFISIEVHRRRNRTVSLAWEGVYYSANL